MATGPALHDKEAPPLFWVGSLASVNFSCWSIFAIRSSISVACGSPGLTLAVPAITTSGGSAASFAGIGGGKSLPATGFLEILSETVVEEKVLA